MVRDMIATRKLAAKRANREFMLIDDELKITSGSTEQEFQNALKFLDDVAVERHPDRFKDFT
jgi:hypothetical protein